MEVEVVQDVTLDGSQQYSMFDEMNSHLVESVLDPDVDLYDGLQDQRNTFGGKGR